MTATPTRAQIYHCTPLTPRDCLETIGQDRNLCVSFWRPDDVEAVERIARTVMFRQRRVLRMAGGDETRGRVVSAGRLVALLPLARTETARRPLGDHSRCARRAFPAQRRAAHRLAVPARAVGPGLAHGRARVPAAAALRSMAARVHRMDWHGRGQGGWLSGLVRADAGHRAAADRALAAASSPARRPGRARVSLCKRGREQRRAEWMAL